MSGHPLNYFEAARLCQSGMLVAVHPAGLQEDWGLAISSLPNPARMHTEHTVLNSHS